MSKYQKEVRFGGESFTIQAETMKDLFRINAHFAEMARKTTARYIKNAKWVTRTVHKGTRDEGTFYEIWAIVDDQPARLSVSEFKKVPEHGVEFFISMDARWETYDKEEETTYVLETRGSGRDEELIWVPAERKNGKWIYLQDGWWNEKEKPQRKKKRRRK